MSVRCEFELLSNMNAWVRRGSLNFSVRSSESIFVKNTECLASGDQQILFQSKDTIESFRALCAYIACY